MELLEQAPENALGDEEGMAGRCVEAFTECTSQSQCQEYSGEWSNDSQKPVRDVSEELPKDGYSGEWSSPGRQKLVTPTWAVSVNSSTCWCIMCIGRETRKGRLWGTALASLGCAAEVQKKRTLVTQEQDSMHDFPKTATF